MADIICRLCSTNCETNIDVFDSKSFKYNSSQLRVYILLATGVDIKETDLVSKMVCERCCEIAVKLHKYRSNAVANDKLLKEKCGQPYQPPLTDQIELYRAASQILNTPREADQSIKKEIVEVENEETDKSGNAEPVHEQSSSPAESLQQKSTPKYIHPSVRTLHKIHKDVRLPSEVFTSDINPVITLDEAEVSEWYTNQVNKYKQKLTGIVITKVPETANTKTPLMESLLNNNAGAQDSCHSNSNNKTADSESIVKDLPDTPKQSVVVKDVQQKENEDKTMKTPSTQATHKAKAKKRTAHLVNNNLSQNGEVIPKKKRRYSETRSVKSSKAVNKMELPEQSPTNKKEAKALFTSSLELTPVGPKSTSSALEITLVNPGLKHPDSSSTSPSLASPSIPTSTSTSVCKSASKPLSPSVSPPASLSRSTSGRQSSSSNNAPEPPSTSPEPPSDPPKPPSTPSKTPSALSEPPSAPPEPPSPSAESSNETVMMSAEKTVAVFVCIICNKLCYSKRGLHTHERAHLSCRFCKVRFRKFETLTKHQNESCVINITRNPPVIKLRKIEEDPEVVAKYRKTFVMQGIITSDASDDIVVVDSVSSQVKTSNSAVTEVTKPQPSILEGLEILTIPGGVALGSNKIIRKASDVIHTVNLETNTVSARSEVVCISDDSDDEVEITGTIPATEVRPGVSLTLIKEASPTSTSPPSSVPDSVTAVISEVVNEYKREPEPFALDLVYNNIDEKQIPHKLLSKYGLNTKGTFTTSTQTFSPSPNNIKYMDNLIILENMYSELYSNKVPIILESNPSITVKFKEEQKPAPPISLECWAHKKAVTVIQADIIPRKCDVPVKNKLLNKSSNNNSVNIGSVALNTPKRSTESVNTTATSSPVLVSTVPIIINGKNVSQILSANPPIVPNDLYNALSKKNVSPKTVTTNASTRSKSKTATKTTSVHKNSTINASSPVSTNSNTHNATNNGIPAVGSNCLVNNAPAVNKVNTILNTNSNSTNSSTFGILQNGAIIGNIISTTPTSSGQSILLGSPTNTTRHVVVSSPNVSTTRASTSLVHCKVPNTTQSALTNLKNGLYRHNGIAFQVVNNPNTISTTELQQVPNQIIYTTANIVQPCPNNASPNLVTNTVSQKTPQTKSSVEPAPQQNPNPPPPARGTIRIKALWELN